MLETENPAVSCFKKLYVLPLHSRDILYLLLSVVKNINMFKSNLVVHSINTRHCSDLYLPSAHLPKIQRAVYHTGIKVFNCLPPRIKSLSSDMRKIQISFRKVSFGRFILYYSRILLTGTY